MDLKLAAISPDAIVYLIVFVLWGLSQLTRLSKKKGGSSPPPEQAPRPVSPELRDLLETLTGRSTELEPPAPPRRVARKAEPASPPPRPTRPYAPAPAEPQAVSARPEAYAVPGVELSRGDFAAAAQLIRQTVAATPVVHLPVIQLASTAAGHAQPAPLLRGLRNPDELRAAFAQRAVLGPPRAFDPP